MAEDGVKLNEDEAERARFAKEKRWGLLTTLAWIATRDMDCAFRASRPGQTIDDVNISIALSRFMYGLEPAHDTVRDAWSMEMAPAISDGKIGGSGSLVSGGVLVAQERKEVGLTFPSPSKPREADHLEPGERGHEVSLLPKGSNFAHTWTDWRDLIFSTSDIFNNWPAVNEADHQPQPTLKFPPPDYRYLSDALTDFIGFKAQHGQISSEEAEREMFDAIKADALRIFFEDERGAIRLLPASDIAEASGRPLFMRIFGAKPLFQIGGNPLAPANGRRALVHERSFHDWTYWVRMSPAAQARANADAKESERLKLIAEADWTPPANYRLADLETACGGHRPWLSQVVNFMAFGTPWGTPRNEEPNNAAAIIAYQAFVGAHQAPVERLLFESGRRGENRFVGILKGEREDRQIPVTTFDHPNLYWADNIIRRAIDHLPAEEYDEARQSPTPDWTQVRLDWDLLKPWLIERGARLAIGESDGKTEAINSRLSRGEISPADAERKRREAGARPGVQQPDRSAFDPASEIEWTISMAVLWIAHGQMDKVVEGMEDFAVNCWYARSKIDGTYYGPDDLDQLDDDAISGGHTIVWLGHDDLNRLLHFRPDSARYREAFETLRRQIIERHTKTYGVRADTRDVIEIEPYKWSRFSAWGIGENGYFLAADEKSSERFFDVWIRREDVPGLKGQPHQSFDRRADALGKLPMLPMSDASLTAAMEEFMNSWTKAKPPSREDARQSLKERYGRRVTHDRIDEAFKDADFEKRAVGRPPKKLADRK